MKKHIYGIVFFTSIMLAACAQSRNIENSYTDEPTNSISYQQFYDDLNPYGQWIDNPEFGRVWAPRETGFQPYYSNGNWVYTNYGWTWVSGYTWGWATFHYGRWFYDNFYGWMWVPGYEWAPAWVSWRQNSDYYGWAPLCPRRSNGSYYEVPNDQWAFIPQQYITRKDLKNYYITRQNNSIIINNTNIINNTTTTNNAGIVNNNTAYQGGPAVAEVEKITNTKLRPVTIKQISAPGNANLQNGVLKIYKPVVKQNTAIESKPAPPNVVTPSSESQSTNESGKIIMPADNITQKTVDPNSNNNPPLNKDQTPVVKENEIKNDQNGQNIPNSAPPPILNTNKTLNNKVIPKQIIVAPTQNPQVKINHRVRTINNQQQTPVNNSRPSVVRPSNSYEKISPASPQNSPGNLNRENNGGRSVRINR